MAFCRVGRSLLDPGAGRGGLAGGQRWSGVKDKARSHAASSPCVGVTVSPQSCRWGRADGTSCSCSGGESFLQPPRRFMLMNCCFGVLLPLLPLALVFDCLRNCRELWRLPGHLPDKHWRAESHMTCGCHQSSWAAGKGLPACPWEPCLLFVQHRQQLQLYARNGV